MDYIKSVILPRWTDAGLMFFFGLTTVISIIVNELFQLLDESKRSPVEDFFSGNIGSVLTFLDGLPLTNYFSLSFVWTLIGIIAFSILTYAIRSYREIDEAVHVIFRYNKPPNYSNARYLSVLFWHAVYHVITFIIFFAYVKFSIDGAESISSIIGLQVNNSENSSFIIFGLVLYYSIAIAAWYYIGAILLRLLLLKKRILFS